MQKANLWFIITLLNDQEFVFIREGKEPKDYIEFEDEFYAIYDVEKLNDIWENPIFELQEGPYSLSLLRQIFYLE